MRALGTVLRLVSLALLACVLVGAAGSAALLAATRIDAPTPGLTPSVSTTSAWAAAPGASTPIAAPGQGSLAVTAVVGATALPLASTAAETVRPIASVAKTMTALVILEIHPLLPGQVGPILTMTQQDVDDYRRIAAAGGSYAPVGLGEHLSEHDLLIGLMLPSANNLALTAARWIDGSVASFVHRLNVRATDLGMHHTHFADPDGLDPGTTSTAGDLLVLGRVAVAEPALVGVVSTARATLPDGTSVRNLDILLGQVPGWLGVKTGWTPQAGGCLLFAARRAPAAGGPPLTIVGAVLGQPRDGNADLAHPELGGAFDVASAAVTTAFAGYTLVRVGPGAIPVQGRVFAPWGAESALQLSGPDTFVLLRNGETLGVAASVTGVSVPQPAGARAGLVTVSRGGTVIGTWLLTTTAALASPSPWWHLLH